ncbi:MAG: hypothetical protein QM534_17080 [Sediminibacterium sp.]|nr:hypothetical protein [Sediminibacterium sp.]
MMKITKLKLIVAFGFGVFLAACSKQEPSCYSRKLEKAYKERMCTMDCPGYVGCDGKTYCNQCEANRNGIR